MGGGGGWKLKRKQQAWPRQPAWKQFTELKPTQPQPCSRKWNGTFQVESLKGVAGEDQHDWDFANVLKSHFARSPDM